MLTEAEVKQALPVPMRSAVNAEVMKVVNSIAADPDNAEAIRENFLTYSHVLKDGKYRVLDYINAVRYVSFKNMGLSNQDAWAKTFPDRYQAMVARGASAKDISASVSIYHKGQLVNKIMGQSMIPVHILFQSEYHKALMVQVHLMNSASSELVRTQAANSVLTHLAKPKDSVAKISIDVGESTAMTELQNTLADLAHQQRKLLEAGLSTKKLAAQDIIEVEAKNV